MLTINIPEKATTIDNLIWILEETINRIKDGCIIGYYPNFTISGEEEIPDLHPIIQGQFDTLDT